MKTPTIRLLSERRKTFLNFNAITRSTLTGKGAKRSSEQKDCKESRNCYYVWFEILIHKFPISFDKLAPVPYLKQGNFHCRVYSSTISRTKMKSSKLYATRSQGRKCGKTAKHFLKPWLTCHWMGGNPLTNKNKIWTVLVNLLTISYRNYYVCGQSVS